MIRRRGHRTGLSMLFLTTILMGTGFSSSLHAGESNSMKNLSPEKVADFIHAIVEADRQVYTTHIVKRMQEQGVVMAREDWENKNAIPLPAQFLHISSKLVAESGHGIRFRLISLWPIYRRNGPATDFERKALEQLSLNSDTPQRGIVSTGKKRLFQAIYADKAINDTCTTCHNGHPLSPKRDFRKGDLMGAIVITIPLED
ncbi:MAG: DUF3365 domain-containing protein [Nitrospirales bacterium]|nr:DUF3365 domain-containing protein [Nitrospirales bacterium]